MIQFASIKAMEEGMLFWQFFLHKQDNSRYRWIIADRGGVEFANSVDDFCCMKHCAENLEKFLDIMSSLEPV